MEGHSVRLRTRSRGMSKCDNLTQLTGVDCAREGLNGASVLISSPELKRIGDGIGLNGTPSGQVARATRGSRATDGTCEPRGPFVESVRQVPLL